LGIWAISKAWLIVNSAGINMGVHMLYCILASIPFGKREGINLIIQNIQICEIPRQKHLEKSIYLEHTPVGISPGVGSLDWMVGIVF
jgi:hypothetical protein